MSEDIPGLVEDREAWLEMHRKAQDLRDKIRPLIEEEEDGTVGLMGLYLAVEAILVHAGDEEVAQGGAFAAWMTIQGMVSDYFDQISDRTLN